MSPEHRAIAQEFLKAQGKLTLHKLAWAAMRSAHSKDQFKLENTILDLVDGINDSTIAKKKDRDEFRKARDEFRNHELSREALAAVMPYVENILVAQAKISDPGSRKYLILNDSDLKMLAILGESEQIDGKATFNATFSSDTSSPSSVMNFTKLIDSSVRNRNNDAHFQDFLEKKVKGLTKDLDTILAALPLSANCRQQLLQQCLRFDATSFDLSQALVKAMSDLDHHLNPPQYDDFWLSVPRERESLKAFQEARPAGQSGRVQPREAIMADHSATESSKQPISDAKAAHHTKSKEASRPDPTLANPKVPAAPTKPSPEDIHAVEEALADRVSQRFAYFVDKKALLANPELLHSLIQAMDRPLTPPKKTRTFVYQGAEYEFPAIAERLSAGERFAELGSPLRLYKLYNQHLTQVPKSISDPDKQDEFVRLWVGVELEHPEDNSFYFDGAIYRVKDDKFGHGKAGEMIAQSPEELLAFKIGTSSAPSPLAEFQQFPSDRVQAIRQAEERGERTYSYQGKLYYLSSVPLDANAARAEFVQRQKETQATQPLTNGQQIRELASKTPLVGRYLGSIRNKPIDTGAYDQFVASHPDGANLVNDALANQRRAFLYHGKAYDTSTLKPVPTASGDNVVENTIRAFRARTGAVSPELIGEAANPGFQAAYYTAIVNNENAFEFEGSRFRTSTLAPVQTNDAIPAQRGLTNTSPRVAEDAYLNGLASDEERVVGYENYYQNRTCPYYTVINKKEAKLKVYHVPDTHPVFQAEVLLGKKHGDKRTEFIQPTEDQKEKLRAEGKPYWHLDCLKEPCTNNETGAGIYYTVKLRTGKDAPVYKSEFNDNLLALKAEDGSADANGSEPILAIHQVPLVELREGTSPPDNAVKRDDGYYIPIPSRMARFNGNTSDDFATNGCPNLRPEDFEKYKAYIQPPKCPVIILPSNDGENEPRSRFFVQSGKLTYIRDSGFPCNEKSINGCDSDYYYSKPSKPSETANKIAITVTDPHFQGLASGYIHALETNKQDMMTHFGVTNDEYDMLVKVAIGTIGVESDLGNSLAYKTKETPVAGAAGVRVSKIVKTMWEAFVQGFEDKAPIAPGAVSNPFDARSRGPTQIKDVRSCLGSSYPQINEGNLDRDDNAAIASIGCLAQRLNTLKRMRSVHHELNEVNFYKYLYYLYNGSPDVKRDLASPENNLRERKLEHFANAVRVDEVLPAAPAVASTE